MPPWGTSILELTPRLVYTRRRDKLLARIWPPKRRKLEMMNRLAEMPLSEVQTALNQRLSDLALYGTAFRKVEHRP